MSDSNTPLDHQDSSETKSGENTLLWTVWFTYGAFYFCRTNISAAVPGMKASVESGGLGFDTEQIGLILGALKIAYAAGQLLNGQLSEKLSPRKMLAIGMFGTALLNVIFGFGTALYFLIFIWACNGFSQSLGWTPCVRVIANWFPVSRRGRVIGLVGTGYQLTAALTFVVSGFAVKHFGWQGALWIPAGIMVLAAIGMLFLLKENPDDQNELDARNLLPESLGHTGSLKGSGNSVRDNFLLTISNPSLWLLGISLGLLNASRYGFLDWGLTHLLDIQKALDAQNTEVVIDEQKSDVFIAALKYAVLPLGGIVGAFTAGWATDRFFGSRRAPVTCILLVALGFLSLVYDSVARTNVPATMILLVAIGFCIFGPQVLLVGTAPADLARKGTSAAAAGFVNCIGYLGAASGDYFTGRSLKYFGWEKTIFLWAGWAFAAAIAVGLLWTATSPDHKKEEFTDEQNEKN